MHVSAIADQLVERLSRPDVTPGVHDGTDAKKYIMALLEQDEGTPVVRSSKSKISSIAGLVKVGTSAPVVTSVVQFGRDGIDDEHPKTEVGAASNIDTGSPVSLAAILRKAGSQKKQAHK